MLQEGVLLAWRSADPLVQVQEVGGALAGRTVISIAAGAPCNLPAFAGLPATCLCLHGRLGRAIGLRWCNTARAAGRGYLFAECLPKTCALGSTPPHPCCINPLQASTGRQQSRRRVTSTCSRAGPSPWMRPTPPQPDVTVALFCLLLLPAAAAAQAHHWEGHHRSRCLVHRPKAPPAPTCARLPRIPSAVVTSCFSSVPAQAEFMSAVFPTCWFSIRTD